MKFLRILLLILATIFIFELTFTKDANAAMHAQNWRCVRCCF